MQTSLARLTQWPATWWPAPCLGCDRPTSADLAPTETTWCDACVTAREPAAAGCPWCLSPSGMGDGRPCARCQPRAPALARVVCAWRYGGSIADAILRSKFGPRFDVARGLALGARPWVRALIELDDLDLVVPVPSHWWRRVRRGIDHAAFLADRACAGTATVTQLLRRVRATPAQARLSASERARNLAGAFQVRRGATRQLAGARVLLFDDVVTTGATLAAAAEALTAAGAAHVAGFALARAARDP